MVEIAPARYLLAVPTGTPVESLEIALLDLLEQLPSTEHYERNLLSALRNEVNSIRKLKKVSKAEILLVATA